MSVAFRRESDDEHLEPRFELPIPPGPNLVTARGRALIDERVAELEHALAAAEDEEARKAVTRDLRYWKTRRATAIETAARADGVVGFGTAVTFTLAGRERQVTTRPIQPRGCLPSRHRSRARCWERVRVTPLPSTAARKRSRC